MLSRRTVLNGGATLGVAALAGCFGSSGGSTAGGEEWLVAPVVFPGGRTSYETLVMSPSAFEDRASRLSEEGYDELRERVLGPFEFARLFPEDIDTAVEGGQGWDEGTGYTVLEGTVDPDELDRNLTSGEFGPLGSYEGFQLYEHDEDPAVVAVDTDVLIGVRDEESDEPEPEQFTEQIVDAGTGGGRRYTESVPEFERVLETIAVGDLFATTVAPEEPTEETDVEDGEFRNAIGRGISVDLNSENAAVELAVPFLDESDPNERELERWTRTADFFDRWRALEVEIDGEIASVTGTLPLRELLEVLDPT